MKTKQCNHCGMSGDHETTACPWTDSLDTMTSQYPGRNAIVIVLLITTCSWIADFFSGTPF